MSGPLESSSCFIAGPSWQASEGKSLAVASDPWRHLQSLKELLMNTISFFGSLLAALVGCAGGALAGYFMDSGEGTRDVSVIARCEHLKSSSSQTTAARLVSLSRPSFVGFALISHQNQIETLSYVPETNSREALKEHQSTHHWDTGFCPTPLQEPNSSKQLLFVPLKTALIWLSRTKMVRLARSRALRST